MHKFHLFSSSIVWSSQVVDRLVYNWSYTIQSYYAQRRSPISSFFHHRTIQSFISSWSCLFWLVFLSILHVVSLLCILGTIIPMNDILGRYVSHNDHVVSSVAKVTTNMAKETHIHYKCLNQQSWYEKTSVIKNNIAFILKYKESCLCTGKCPLYFRREVIA